MMTLVPVWIADILPYKVFGAVAFVRRLREFENQAKRKVWFHPSPICETLWPRPGNSNSQKKSMELEADKHRLVESVELIVRTRMNGQAAGHGMDHVLRVLASARKIHADSGGDLQVVELAALLHDVGDAKFHNGEERSAEFAREILGELGTSRELIEHVAHIVDNISFRKRTDPNELSLEGKIVQDADRLDALGAIGIVRTIEYGAMFGQSFYLPDSGDVKTGVDHFYEKLFKLKDMLNTDVARRMAVEREMFMRAFLDQFMREWHA